MAVAPGMKREYGDILGDGFEIHEDRKQEGGPLEGLITSLDAAKGDIVLICPCDTPFMKPDLLESIAKFGRERDGAVPVVRGYIEPLHCALRRTHALAALEEAAEEGIKKLADAYKMLDLAMIDEDIIRTLDPNLESFWNLNTPEDLASAEEKMRHQSF